MLRDFKGYGSRPPTTLWPHQKKLAVSLVVNYEEGSERSFAAGDPDQEPMTEWGSYPLPQEIRNLAMESMFEYGSRVGVWRILESLERHDVPATFFACAVALEEQPEVAKAIVAHNHEVCSHGYRWEEAFRLSKQEEKERIHMAVESFKKTTGSRPAGWYCRYGPSENTRQLLKEEGGFLYDCDAYNDDVPYFVSVEGAPHLIIPYSPDTNDFGFWQPNGPTNAEQFFTYLKDSFDTLYQESAEHPRMMSIGLHCRIIGRPGRINALNKFIEYAKTFDGVWFATRSQIAEHWYKAHEVDRGAGEEK